MLAAPVALPACCTVGRQRAGREDQEAARSWVSKGGTYKRVRRCMRTRPQQAFIRCWRQPPGCSRATPHAGGLPCTATYRLRTAHVPPPQQEGIHPLLAAALPSDALGGLEAQSDLAQIAEKLKSYRPSQTVFEAEVAAARKGSGAGAPGGGGAAKGAASRGAFGGRGAAPGAPRAELTGGDWVPEQRHACGAQVSAARRSSWHVGGAWALERASVHCAPLSPLQASCRFQGWWRRPPTSGGWR